MFDYQRALTCAQVCAYTYQNDVHAVCQQAGIAWARLIYPDNPVMPMLGLVVASEHDIVVAWRGTVVAHVFSDLEKWQDMLLGMAVNVAPTFLKEETDRWQQLYSGAVHWAYAALLEDVWEQIRAVVSQRVEGRRLWLTGHSQGGALAILAAYRFYQDGCAPTAVYTFGTPRVGSQDFATVWSRTQLPHYRCEQDGDIVPFLPPGPTLRVWVNHLLREVADTPVQLVDVPYEHTGALRYLSQAGPDEMDSPGLRFARAASFLSKAITPWLWRELLRSHAIQSYLKALQKRVPTPSHDELRPALIEPVLGEERTPSDVWELAWPNHTAILILWGKTGRLRVQYQNQAGHEEAVEQRVRVQPDGGDILWIGETPVRSETQEPHPTYAPDRLLLRTQQDGSPMIWQRDDQYSRQWIPVQILSHHPTLP